LSDRLAQNLTEKGFENLKFCKVESDKIFERLLGISTIALVVVYAALGIAVVVLRGLKPLAPIIL